MGFLKRQPHLSVVGRSSLKGPFPPAKRYWLGYLGALLVSLWIGSTGADTVDNASQHAIPPVAQLQQAFELLGGHSQTRTGARSDQENAFAYQQDQRLLQFLKRYVRVLADGSSVSSTVSPVAYESALALLDKPLDALIESRLARLEERIEQRTALAATMSGIEQITAQAYVEGLIQLRVRYLVTLVDVIDVRAARGQPATTLVSMLRERLQHSTEALLGTIGYGESA